jgi:iron(III) transport system ATP-binding protein
LTAIYVTHDQKEALSIADRMAVLNKGHIEQVGRPRDLYHRPNNLFVAGFMGETNFISGTIASAQNGSCEIETAIGKITSSAFPDSINTGDPITLSLRPESLRLGETASDALNAFDAQIHDTVYLGEVAQHQVSIGENGQLTTLKAFELNPKFVARDESRQRARISFDPGDAVVLKD